MATFEDKPIRGYNKWEMLYPDRCMMKWQGMLLSDHTEHIRTYKEGVLPNFHLLEDLDEQITEGVDVALGYALKYGLSIKIVYKESKGREASCEGVLKETREQMLFLETDSGRKVIRIMDIVSVDLV